jgi:uncharacterized protein YbaR (Trm112 family)/ubiquinone/menaquinone biosynthesis C-methylase UbiE
VKKELLDILVCPHCKNKLELENPKKNNEQIKSGTLFCRNCNQEYPIKKYVPRFVNSDEYADTFSTQRMYVRKHFKDYQKDTSGDIQFLDTTGFDEQNIKSGISLEVGCGYGRFLDVVERMGGKIIGIDLSTHSIELAQDYVGLKDNVHLVQCDLNMMPFIEETFDQVFSIGVLHHTPNTRKSFISLIPFVKKGGGVAIWVYPPEMKKLADKWRVVTTKMPSNILYLLCIINQFLFSWIRMLPGGWRFSYIIPGAIPKHNNTYWMRVISDYDNLSPQYAYSHTPEEVSNWFKDVGLCDIKIQKRRTAVKGVK